MVKVTDSSHHQGINYERKKPYITSPAERLMASNYAPLSVRSFNPGASAVKPFMVVTNSEVLYSTSTLAYCFGARLEPTLKRAPFHDTLPAHESVYA